MTSFDQRAISAALACLLFPLCAVFAAAADAAVQPANMPVATVGGHSLLYSALQARTQAKLAQLDAQRDAEVRQITLATARDRATYVDAQLNSLIDEELLALDAASKKTTPGALLSAVTVPPVTDAMMQAFYKAQSAMIGQPYERIKPQLKQYLQRQASVQATRNLYASLRKKYGVKVLLAPMREHVEPTGPARGPANAPVTIVEFSDFQCPFCGRLEPELQHLLKAYPSRIRLVYRNLPLESLHPNAMSAAQAGVCAGQQGKFWQMHDLMFAEQNALTVPALKDKAKRIGLNTQQFDQCLDSGATLPAIKADLDAAKQLGLSTTPTTFVNGRFIDGAVSYADLTALVDDELQRLPAPVASR